MLKHGKEFRMYIKSVTAPGFKNREIKCNLDQSNIITSDPFTGKTAISEAIHVGMYGFRHGDKTGNEATFKLSSDPRSLFVRLKFDDDSENTVAIDKTETGFTRTGNLTHKFPEVLMNAEKYFEKTEQLRLQYVLDRVNLKKAGYDEAALLKQLSAWKPRSPEEEKAKLKWAKFLSDTIAHRDKINASISSWMETVIAQLKKTRDKELKVSIKEMEAICKNILAQDEPEDVSREKADLDQQLIDLKAKRASASADAANEVADKLNTLEDRINELKDDLGEIEAEEIKMKKRDCCPMCKNKGKDWRKHYEEWNEARKAPLQTQLKTLQAEEKKLQQQPQPKRSKRDGELDRDIEALEDTVDAITEKANSHAAWVLNRETLRTKEAALKLARAETEIINHFIDTLVTCQAKIVEAAFNGLLKIARQFTDGLLLSALEYRDGELGRNQDGVWVSHEVFSGTEKLLTYSGLQIALCQESPMRIVILDEMGRAPAPWKVRIADRMVQLIKAGVIDQWLGIDCEGDWAHSSSLRKTVNVIKL